MARAQLMAAWFVGLATLQLVFAAPITIITASTSDNEVLVPTSGTQELTSAFGKTFRMDSCDNMVGALQAFGINETLSRSLAEEFTFGLMLNEDNEEYTLTSDMYLKVGSFPIKFFTSKVPFRLGQNIEIMNYDGESVKAVYTLDGNILTETRSGKNPGTTTRIFTPEQVKTTFKTKGVVNNCVYKPE